MVLRVFMDESGTHENSPAITTSAIWTTPGSWSKWRNDWKRTVGKNGTFHACENWTKFDHEIITIQKLFAKRRINVKFSGINMNDYRGVVNVLDKDIIETFGDPYYAVVTWMFKHVCECVSNYNNGNVVIFIHEEGRNKVIKQSFQFVQKEFPNLHLSLEFAKKGRYVELEAADYVSNAGYHSLGRVNSSRSITNLVDPSGKRSGSIIYDKSNMLVMMEHLASLMPKIVDKKNRAKEAKRLKSEEYRKRNST